MQKNVLTALQGLPATSAASEAPILSKRVNAARKKDAKSQEQAVAQPHLTSKSAANLISQLCAHVHIVGCILSDCFYDFLSTVFEAIGHFELNSTFL